MSNFGLGSRLPRGPYGTNEGDTWLAPGSDIQRLLDEDGKGLVLVHAMLRKDGRVQESIFTTEVGSEVHDDAVAGHELWVAAQAAMN